MNMKSLFSFKASVIVYQSTQLNVTEYLNLQQYIVRISNLITICPIYSKNLFSLQYKRLLLGDDRSGEAIRFG